MLLTLKDIKIKEWDNSPSKIDFVDYVYQEALELNVWREGNKKDMAVHYQVTDLSGFFYADADFEGLVIGGELMVWFFAFDDQFDSLSLTEEQQYETVERMKNVFKTGELEENPNGPERIAQVIRNKCYNKCAKKNRLDIFHRFNYSCIQWVDSIIPFMKLKERDNKELDINTYLEYRKINIGDLPCIFLHLIVYDNEIENEIWDDPRWKTMCELNCMIIALYNDCISYVKEMDENGCDLNPLLFLQKQNNIDIAKSYNVISTLINSYYDKYLELEQEFLNTYHFDGDSNKRKQFEYLVKQTNNLMTTTNVWSSQSARYYSSTQIFIELKRD